jgi:hypothetical protein
MTAHSQHYPCYSLVTYNFPRLKYFSLGCRMYYKHASLLYSKVIDLQLWRDRRMTKGEGNEVVEGRETIPLLTPYKMGNFNLSHR